MSGKGLGVTHAIREKLNFLDERRWKKFSARRLELIDTLDLSSKKASEQELAIHNVAEALRIEFNYSSDYFEEFDKLVRAAIQSVRRNRKRSTVSKRPNTFRVKIPKVVDESIDLEDTKLPVKREDTNFLSDITRLESDSEEPTEYSKSKHVSDQDKTKLAINAIIQPRFPSSDLTSLPQIPAYSGAQILEEMKSSQQVILNYIQKSKTCSESATTSLSPNLEHIGKGVITACVGYVFETSFVSINTKSVEYLREKLTQESYLANIYRDLDQEIASKHQFNDDVVVSTLYAILGACIKDFGFELIMMNLCELFYLTIVKQYPLVTQHSIPFKASEHLKSEHVKAENVKSEPAELKETDSSESFMQLNSLAAIASDIREHTMSNSLSTRSISPNAARTIVHQDQNDKKAVTIKFLSSVLNFTFPSNTSAIPKLDELLENVRSAFNLSKYSDSQVLGLRNLKYGFIIKSDSDLEKVFLTEDSIELEVFTQRSHAVPTYEITSMVVPNQHPNLPGKIYREDERIILPPPISSNSRAGSAPIHPAPASSFKFLSNLEESSTSGPPVPVLPKFQPLL